MDRFIRPLWEDSFSGDYLFMGEDAAGRLQIKDAIQIINQMREAGVIDRYAIGGAVGATFYLEPVRTIDVDIFVAFPSKAPGTILTLDPIYDFLTKRGSTVEGEYLVMAGWPVQFLPSTGPLVDEAILEACEFQVDEVATRVFTAEHLVAIALQTGRPKDKARILQFKEAGAIDSGRLQRILERHDLTERWTRFEQQFSTDL